MMSLSTGMMALGLTKRDAYKGVIGLLMRRIAILDYDTPMKPFSEEIAHIIHEPGYRKMLVSVGAIGHEFLLRGIDGYTWQDVLTTVIQDNSTVFRQLIEDSEDSAMPLEVNDDIVNDIFGEVVGLFLTKFNDNNKAPEDTGIISAVESPMITQMRSVLRDVIDRVSVDRIFPDVHSHLTRV